MIHVLIAHSSRLIGDSLRASLEADENVYVVGCATTEEEVHFLLPHAEVILLGTALADAAASDVLDEIRMTHPETKVLVLGVNESPDNIIRYIEAGAAGYILQNESVEDTMRKLHAAHQERAIVSPVVAAAMMERLTRLANLTTPIAFLKARETELDELTAREEEVLDLISAGCSNQEIADRLVIACGTVKNHVHNILKKLEVTSRHEAASIFEMNRQNLQPA